MSITVCMITVLRQIKNNNTFEELVLEKVYPDGGYETELVDFYLVNPETLEVIDEQKSSW